jgi:hypothetical protein
MSSTGSSSGPSETSTSGLFYIQSQMQPQTEDGASYFSVKNELFVPSSYIATLFRPPRLLHYTMDRSVNIIPL